MEIRATSVEGNLNQGATNMETKGFVVPPGGGSVLDMEPGRSAALKLLSGQTAESVMLFEETVPPGTGTPFHLHHDSDEVAYVLSGEITFLIGDAVTVGGAGSCAFFPRTVRHAWKNTGAETGRVHISLHAGRRRKSVRGAGAAPGHVAQRLRVRRDASTPSLGGRWSMSALI
jgi:quercetin dioxygenase-like cupin family protein